MVPISSKSITSRAAVAVCSIYFSNSTALPLIRSNQLKKGDVLGVARIAGIMAAKKTSELIPLCHPIAITHVGVELDVVGSSPEKTSGKEEGSGKKQGAHSVLCKGTGQGDAYPFHTPADSSDPSTNVLGADKQTEFGQIDITATVSCDGKTGVEMEALTAASTAALTVYDMCKAVDKGMRIEGLRVVRKEGGKSGLWVEGVQENHKMD
jgi:molybdenum cofactor biosynthesis enzyme